MIKFKDFSRPLSVFQVLFKANLIFEDFSRQSCIFKYFSSLCEPWSPTCEASAAVHTMAVVPSLFIHCLLLLPSFGEDVCLVLVLLCSTLCPF